MTDKLRTSSLKKTVSLKTRITSLSFIVSDQIKFLLVKLYQSYSRSQDRRSMEYSVENQIANRLIAMGEKKKSSFIQIYLEYQILLQSINCSLLLVIWNVTSVMWHIQTSNMWNLMYYRDILQICLFESPYFESISKISLLDKKPLLKPKYI